MTPAPGSSESVTDWLRPGPVRLDLRGRTLYSGLTRLSRWGLSHLDWLNRVGARLTVRDLFPGCGDALLTGIICRHVHERWPRLRLNCITRHPDLFLHDPHLSELNGPPGAFVLDAWYLDIVQRRDNHTNVVTPTLAAIGIHTVDYRARVYLGDEERAWARDQLAALDRPRIAINLLSAVPTKNWPLHRWHEAVQALRVRGAVVHLGDEREPALARVTRYAGQTSLRQSLALMAECDVFIGPVSFLMHAANAVDVPAVITFGGQHSPSVSGYAENRNLYVELPCSGCWLTGAPGDECPQGLACQEAIGVATVIDAVDAILQTGPRPHDRLRPLSLAR